MNKLLLAVLLATPLAAWVGPAAAGPEEAMTKAGCMACHAKDKKMVGPSFQQIAARHKGKDVASTLVQKVRSGGKGVYGPVPMAPNGPDKISDADLGEAVAWILKQ